MKLPSLQKIAIDLLRTSAHESAVDTEDFRRFSKAALHCALIPLRTGENLFLRAFVDFFISIFINLINEFVRSVHEIIN